MYGSDDTTTMRLDTHGPGGVPRGSINTGAAGGKPGQGGKMISIKHVKNQVGRRSWSRACPDCACAAAMCMHACMHT